MEGEEVLIPHPRSFSTRIPHPASRIPTSKAYKFKIYIDPFDRYFEITPVLRLLQVEYSFSSLCQSDERARYESAISISSPEPVLPTLP